MLHWPTEILPFKIKLLDYIVYRTGILYEFEVNFKTTIIAKHLAEKVCCSIYFLGWLITPSRWLTVNGTVLYDFYSISEFVQGYHFSQNTFWWLLQNRLQQPSQLRL